MRPLRLEASWREVEVRGSFPFPARPRCVPIPRQVAVDDRRGRKEKSRVQGRGPNAVPTSSPIPRSSPRGVRRIRNHLGDRRLGASSRSVTGSSAVGSAHRREKVWGPPFRGAWSRTFIATPDSVLPGVATPLRSLPPGSSSREVPSRQHTASTPKRTRTPPE